MLVVRLLVLLLILCINLAACHSSDGKLAAKTKGSSSKGELKMKTYYMGRFAIDVPVEMKQEVQAQRIRYAEIEDVFEWSRDNNREKERSAVWKVRIAQINELHKPQNISSVIIEDRAFPGLGSWGYGVHYYGDYILPERHFWTVLVDYGNTGIWLTVDGTNDDMSLENIANILKNYSENKSVSRETFYLKKGGIKLPYLEQESTYSRFQDNHSSVRLEVEMNETQEVEQLGMADRLAAAMATRFAPGVDVEKLRSRSRTAAGLKGEELVLRMSASGEDTQVQFSWEYRGEVDSGERPEVEVTMEAPDVKLEEKMRVWDSILDSFRPLYR